MKDWILYNWKEISVVLYLVIGLPFAYVWTGEEFKKNTEDPYYSNRYSRNYWFTYVLIFCVCVLFWPLKFIINMMKKAVERRRKRVIEYIEPTFQEKVYHFNHKNRQNSVDKRREHFYNRKFHKGRGKV